MGEHETQIVNFDRICRLCLHEKRTLTEIFESTLDNNISIDRKIMTCATIELCQGDGLPSRICIKCLSCVNAAFEFRVQCENADKTLHDLHDLMSIETVKDQAIAIGTGTEEAKRVEGLENMEVEEEEDDEEEEEVEDNEDEEVHTPVKAMKALAEEDVNSLIFIEKDQEKTIKAGDIVEEDGNLYYVMEREDDAEEKESSAYCMTADLLYYDQGSLSAASEVSEEEIVRDSNPIYETENQICFTLEDETDEKREYDVVFNKTINENNVVKNAVQNVIKKDESGESSKSPCPFCNKMLSRVDEHIRLLHRNKVYMCSKSECGAQFLTLKNLQSHQLTCYGLEKTFKCGSCSKQFHRKSNYKAHVRRHSNKKEFQCQLCDRAFVDSTGLRRHFLKHHDPEQLIFVSACCGKKFKSKEGMTKHIHKKICGVEIFHVIESPSNDEANTDGN